MKLKSLIIESHRHLENVFFDFTYPQGHSNAGKPLNKICIIGQSATGKTSLLELIKENLSTLESIEIVNGTYIDSPYKLSFKGFVEFIHKNDTILLGNSKILKNDRIYSSVAGGSGSVGKFITDGLKLLYLTSEIISQESVAIFNQNPINIFAEDRHITSTRNNKDSSYIYEFLQEINKDIWFALLYKILDYRKRFTQMAAELINKGTIGDPGKLNKEFNQWSEKNKNPLDSFAKYFNPVLAKLNLEVDLVNTEYSIPIKSKVNDEVIPVSGLSTGTKGLLLSMFPIFELNTDDAIILLDEPERSLFPDMQIDLISHYENIAPSAQFIVATHSPFIAAAFEPEERFILYFDEKGKVAVRRGESPIGDDPNDILKNDFNVDYYNEFGKKAYQQYLDLKRKVADEPEKEEKEKLLNELAELGDKYNF